METRSWRLQLRPTKDGGKGTCKVYGRFDHEESSNYEVIEYPPGWGTRG